MAHSVQEYKDKFDKIKIGTLFQTLDADTQNKVFEHSSQFKFTHQELRLFVNGLIDLKMWEEGDLFSIWQEEEGKIDSKGRSLKKTMFENLRARIEGLKTESFEFPEKNESVILKNKKTELKYENPRKEVFGMCAVQSEKTSCCNLRTIDAVKNCGFGCSYCSIQTMYGEEKVVFDEGLNEKLDNIQLDPNKRYHVGTGQSSDSLMWGNTNGVLESMLGFAKKWPNVLLEFKTKSKNVKSLLKLPRPSNIVCSWSVNPNAVIKNEEHLTASLEERIGAAVKCVENGIKVGFHLHPMIFYKGWENDYKEMIKTIVQTFSPEDVLFVSFGSLTFSKPVIKKIRQYNFNSKMLQMPMVANPEGKQSYPYKIKESLFQLAYSEFEDWHSEVYFFLCMEEHKLWDEVLGFRYNSNEEFEVDFMNQVFPKL